MSILVGAQVVFCFVVHLIAGLFVSTFERMENQPIGFSAEQLLTLDTVARTLQPDETWYRAADHLRSLPGVESAAAAQFPLMSGAGTNRDVWANGHAPDEGPAPWFLGVSPGWLSTMKIPILEGVDFRSEDAFPLVAAVNQSFAKRYFDGRSPVGRTFDTQLGPNRTTIRIVALVADARYTGMRGPIPATAYVPFHRTNYGPEAGYRGATFLVRTKHKDPLSLAVLLRQEVSRANTDLRVANIRTQEELVRQHTIRERLLAMLSMFFASVALILAAVGLYGLLDYAVLARRRELGIRIALGARAGDVVWRVTAEVLMMLLGGATIGLALGIASERYLGALLYQVKATEPMVLAIPALMLGAATILAAFPPALRATRIDPSKLLRSD